MNLATENLNRRNYARCEWKCMEWIGTEVWGTIHHEASVQTRFIASPQRAETRSNLFHTLQRTAGRQLNRRWSSPS